MIVNIQGSYGTLTVDSVAGDVLERNFQEGSDETGYPEIHHFDPITLTGSHLDILECGYWTQDNTYVPPEEDFIKNLPKPDGVGV